MDARNEGTQHRTMSVRFAVRKRPNESASVADAIDSILESVRTASNANAVGFTLPPWIGIRCTEFSLWREVSCNFDYTTNYVAVGDERVYLIAENKSIKIQENHIVRVRSKVASFSEPRIRNKWQGVSR